VSGPLLSQRAASQPGVTNHIAAMVAHRSEPENPRHFAWLGGDLRKQLLRRLTDQAQLRAVILVNSSQEEQKRVWRIERASLQESQCRSRKPLPNPTVLPTRREVPESLQVPQRFTVDNLTVSNQSCAQSRLPFWPGVWTTAS
jgi:hypothetical protein